LFIILSEALLAVVNTLVKYVHHWETERIMIVRFSVDLLLCMAMWAICRYEVPGYSLALLCLLRGLACIGLISFMWAALHTCLPLGDVAVLVITCAQIFSVLFARVLLGEKFPRGWPVQFALCLLGAVLISKPWAPHRFCGLENALLPLIAGLAGGCVNLLARRVGDVPSPIVCIFNDVAGIVLATSASMMSSKAGTELLPRHMDKSLALMIAAGVVGWMGLLGNVKGYVTVSVPAVASIAAYAAVPLNFMLQVYIFQEIPDMLSIAGAVIIVSTNIAAIASRYFGAKAELPVSPDSQAADDNKAAGFSLIVCIDEER